MNSWQQSSSEEFVASRISKSPTGRIRLLESLPERKNMQRALHFARNVDDCVPRMQTPEKGGMQCYTTDEGRPFGICLQGPVPNRPRLLRLNGRGGERRGKRPGKEPGQVSDKKMNASEPLMTYRKRREDVKTVRSRYHGSRSGENLLTAWSASGRKVA